MRALFLCSLLVCFLDLGPCSVQARARRDLTRESESSGSDVVRAVVSLIQASNIFPDDHQFLRRIAYVESNDGTHPNTYREGYHGGIWQVDSIGFDDTKDVSSHPGLTRKHQLVLSEFKIKWEDVEWKDLRKPLYSGLAARLLLSNKDPPIPTADNVMGQARYWKTHYNTEDGEGTTEDFIERVNALRSQTSSDCNVKIDLVFVMDTSGSIGSNNFELMRNFVRTFSNGLDIGPNENQVAVVTFSGSAVVQFGFNQHNTKDSLLAVITSLPYDDGGSTDIAAALDALLDSVFTRSAGARLNSLDVLRIAIVMTDGQSNDLVATMQAAMRVHSFQPAILVYAVAIGDNVNQAEINAIATRPEFIVQLGFTSGQFDAVREERTYQICFEASTPTNPNEKRRGSLPSGEATRLQFPITEAGITIQLCVSQGRIVFYASVTMPPSEAFYDWKLVSNTGCKTTHLDPHIVSGGGRRKRQVSAPETLYVTIQGDADGDNSFELESAVSKPGQAVQIEPKTQEPVVEGESITFSCLGADVSSVMVDRRMSGADFGELPPFGTRLNITRMESGRVDYTLGPLLREDDTTVLYCLSGASISTEVQLSVYYPPRYTSLPSSVITVIERQMTTINFELAANPFPTSAEYIWYRNGEILSPSYRVNTLVDSLTFNPGYVGDAGMYEVVAHNFLGNTTLVFRLSVDYSPMYVIDRYGSFTCQKSGPLIECVAPEGATGYLKCAAFGKPKAVLSLNTRVRSSDNVFLDMESGDVVIEKVTEDNKGVYTCTATNRVKQVQRTFLLSVGDGSLPPVKDLKVALHRVQDDFILTVDWEYNTTSLTLLQTNFVVSLHALHDPRPIRKWTPSRESRNMRISLAGLNLTPSVMYYIYIYSQNTIARSTAENATFIFPDCPPLCSNEYCSVKPNRRALCTMTSTMRSSNCSTLCPISFCHICYFNEELRDSSEYACNSCSEGFVSGTLTQETRCFKRWAKCVRGSDFGLYGKTPPLQQREEDFKCYEHPCV